MDDILKLSDKTILGLIPAQALIDFDRAKDVLEKVIKAQADHMVAQGWKSPEEVSAIQAVITELRTENDMWLKNDTERKLNMVKWDAEKVENWLFNYGFKVLHGTNKGTHAEAAALLAALKERSSLTGKEVE